MTRKDLIPLVKEAILEAALAYEIHNGKGDQWRRVFKRAVTALPVKAGLHYRFLVRMTEQDRASMDGVVRTLCRAAR